MFHILDFIKIFFYLGQFGDQSSPFGSQESNWDLGLKFKNNQKPIFRHVSDLGYSIWQTKQFQIMGKLVGTTV